MTKEEFRALAVKGPVLLDGATGSNLRSAGMPVGVSPELWILDHPQVMIDLQRGYADAGSQIVFAPTFSANRIALAGFGLADRLEELSRRLVAVTREAVGDRCLIAADISTLGQPLEPLGPRTYQEAYDVYCQQIEAAVKAGVDLLGAETMLSVDETAAALDAAQAVCDLPMMCSMTVEADGSLLFGGTAAEAVATLQAMGAAAVGINCSVGPDQLESVVRSMAAVAEVPVIAKPNAGLPAMTETGEAVYSMGPEDFVRHMVRLLDAGAGIVGGCCGTTPAYIRLLSQVLSR